MLYTVWTFVGSTGDYECAGIFSNKDEAEALALTHPDRDRLFSNRPTGLPLISHPDTASLAKFLMRRQFGEMVDQISQIALALDVKRKRAGWLRRLWGDAQFPLDVRRADAKSDAVIADCHE